MSIPCIYRATVCQMHLNKDSSFWNIMAAYTFPAAVRCSINFLLPDTVTFMKICCLPSSNNFKGKSLFDIWHVLKNGLGFARFIQFQ